MIDPNNAPEGMPTDLSLRHMRGSAALTESGDSRKPKTEIQRTNIALIENPRQPSDDTARHAVATLSDCMADAKGARQLGESHHTCDCVRG